MRRVGFSLVELLVAIGVIAILLALLLPAVQSTREAARRTECRSKLHQFGVAIHAYHSDYGMFPLGSVSRKSMHVSILPYVDQQALFNLIPPRPSTIELDAIAGNLIPLYFCPSDPYSDRANPYGPVYPTSYAMNFGTGVQTYGYNGMFSYDRIRSRDVTDGLSQTAALAEILVGHELPDLRRAIWRTPYELIQPDQLEQFAHLCRQTAYNQGSTPQFGRGFTWAEGHPRQGGYNHVLFPNDVSCTNESKIQQGAYSAGSIHDGGVHVAFGDGHVGFVSTQVDFAVWRAIGSRNGSESAAGGF